MRNIFRNTRAVRCNMLAAIAGAVLLFIPQRIYASEGEEYITISVDAMDGSGKVTYALDTDDPAAFTESNEFAVPEGTTHTIYVKDEAGNITSQEYPGQTPVPPDSASFPDHAYLPNTEAENGMQEDGDFHIDIELDRTSSGIITDKEPAELGGGTVYDKTKTDVSADAEKVFYTITTNEGEVFYLVIDQGQTSDNVYLLDQVKLSDLKALSIDDAAVVEEEEKSDSLLDVLSNADSPVKETLPADEPAEPSSGKNSSALMILILAAAGGAVYYYMKVYKNKRDAQMDLADAMEREDFSADYPEEEEIDFELEEGYQEEALSRLFEEEEEEYTDPEAEKMAEDPKEEEFIPVIPEEPEDFVPEPEFDEFEEEEELL